MRQETINSTYEYRARHIFPWGEAEINHVQRVALCQLSLVGMIYELMEEKIAMIEGEVNRLKEEI
jgi:hypothetical protein